MQRSVELDSSNYDYDYESTTEGIRPRPMGNYPTQASLLSSDSAPKNKKKMTHNWQLEFAWRIFLHTLCYPLACRVAKVL